MFDQITDDIKKAMFAKDSVKLTTLRGVSATFTNEILAKKVKGNSLPDADALAIIKRLVKQRKDSIEQFKKGGREDLVKEEQDELEILETYLPKLMEKEEVAKVAHIKKEELGILDPKDKGKLMSVIMKDLKGKADGQVVKEVVDALF